jgi:hypothetical protein
MKYKIPLFKRSDFAEIYTTFARLLAKQDVGRESASRANGRLMTP